MQVPEDIVERVRTLCLALPEVTVRSDTSRVATRSTAWSFDVRRRSFCLLVAVTDPSGKHIPLVRLCRPVRPQRLTGHRSPVLCLAEWS